MKNRGFEIVSTYNKSEIVFPIRKTKYSAGYDISSSVDISIPPYKFGDKPVLVKTGIKAYMKNDEYLMLCNRSSNPLKRGLVLANGVGIIDSDYYNNPDNEGEIMYCFYNFQDLPYEIKKGDIIGQAIFMKYEISDNDNSINRRIGGFGSTDTI